MKHISFLPWLIALVIIPSCGTTPAGQTEHVSQGSDPTNGTVPLLEDVQERGRYLVTILGCGDCHSPKVMGAHGPEPAPGKLFSGHPAGTQLPPVDKNATSGWVLFSMDQTATVGPWGTSFAGNITSDQTGIGAWSEEQFSNAVRKGWFKGIEGGRRLLPPMPWPAYAAMSDEDLHAIYTYLVSTEAVENVVPAPLPPL